MARDRRKVKGRQEGGSFIKVPHAVLESESYTSLSARSVKLLFDLYGQYRGNNNGDFTAALSVMQKKGWRSKDSLNKARRELLEKGFIIQTRQGWNRRCNLYGVTFQAIDECKGKLDISPTSIPYGWWKDGGPPK